MKLLIASVAVGSLLFAGVEHAGAIEKGTREKPQKEDLKPGQYVWEPQAADKGSVDIVVSLGEQKLAVYRDGVEIGRSTISSGRKDYETPKGIYMIVEKNVTHHSNKYHEASMPFMERLTWSGLAIHAGNTPGYPESHGCMHVPEDFAKKLYGVAAEGNTVLVANGSTKPEKTPEPNLLFADSAAAVPGALPAPGGAPDFTWKPEEVPSGPVAIVVSSADKRVYVYRKGVQIGGAEIGGEGAGRSFGNVIYAALEETSPDGLHQWNLLGRGDDSPALDFQDLAKALVVPPEFRKHLKEIVAPGTTLVITDHTANPTKPTGPDND